MSSAAAAPAGVTAVLEALRQLYSNPDSGAKASANTALQRFQKMPEAWTTANELLLAQELPLESRLFAAQTFRSKAMFDLEELPDDARVALRDTLLHALTMYARGPRVVQTQLCLALAALALQMPDGLWPRVVPAMVERFGAQPETVGVLLEFLSVLPEEVSMNHRIPIDNAAYHERVPQLLTQQSATVMQVLAMYIQADGVTEAIQQTVFHCLRSWLKSGEVSALQLADTPLLAFAFDALGSEPLFDIAVDVLCDVINETQEIDENMRVIEELLPRIQALRPALLQAGDDEDRVRGLCRVFVQAGETYHTLLLQHASALLPVVQAVLDCASYHDLDIVQITFRFWYLLATHVHKADAAGDPAAAAFCVVYEQLFAIVVRHLCFPDDEQALTGQERDDFRSFRHYMGDTLKDCCYVLSAEACLQRSLQMVEAALAAPAFRWQDVEAPLFSMRSMGAQVDLRDNTVVPRIFAIVPQLPPHPRLRYAGLLVISRYTEWVEAHPEHIPEILTFITTGFDGESKDISAAAAQAMNFLCQDCREHLNPFLPQLLAFFRTMCTRLAVDDLLSVAEAVAHVITALPPAQATETLLAFTQPLLEGLHAVSMQTAPDRAALMQAADRMEQLARILQVLGVSLTGALPDGCADTCAEAYAVVDRLLAHSGNVYFLSERTSALVRRALLFFGPRAEPTLPALLDRFAGCFEATGYSGYVWIVGKCLDQYGHRAPPPLRALLARAFERVTGKVIQLLSASSPDHVSDVLDDYLHTCLVATGSAPVIVFLSPHFAQIFHVAVAALTALSPGVVGIASDVIRTLLELPAGVPDAHQGPHIINAQEAATYADVVARVVSEQGFDVCRAMLVGLVTHFPPENMSTVVSSLRALARIAQAPFSQWVAAACEALPVDAISLQDRARFLESMDGALADREDRIKQSLVLLYSASRKSRERARLEEEAADVSR
ncbi:Nuclear import receptor [Malassezia sp. CBS 17886]|nr:Nuclear import receptor [Malassezia sp. CBS 17886]